VLKRWLLYTGSVVAGLAIVGALLGAFVLALLWPTLPPLDALTDYQPKIPLRVVSADGDLLGEFGEERRAVIRIGEVPDVMKHAILAAEDERFYQHGGVDYLSIARAALSNVTSGTQQGAGTITMQVARNFFLTREKTVSRKLREVLLAWKIEASLPKDEILELYINQIFLGQRAYGFAAAAQIYFGKPLADVTVAEAAMLAGLPKAPSAYNPVSNPRRAKTRQLYVLRRMHELGYINDDQWRKAQSEPLTTRVLLREPLSVHAEFVAEMARQVVYDAYGDDAYTRGITGWTTIRYSNEGCGIRAQVERQARGCGRQELRSWVAGLGQRGHPGGVAAARAACMLPSEHRGAMSITDEFQTAYAQLREPAVAGPDLLPTRLAQACTRVLPIDGAGISMFTAPTMRIPIGASGDDATIANDSKTPSLRVRESTRTTPGNA